MPGTSPGMTNEGKRVLKATKFATGTPARIARHRHGIRLSLRYAFRGGLSPLRPDDDVAQAVDDAGEAGVDEGGGVVLFEDRGAAYLRAGGEREAGVDRGLAPFPFPPDAPRAGRAASAIRR